MAAERAGADPAVLERARRHVYAAEASDWYWWYGEDFTTELAAEFDGALPRARHPRGAPRRREPAPRGARAHQARRDRRARTAIEAKPLREPTFLLTPTLDGRETTFFEWQGSGLYRPGQHRGSMYGGAQAFHVLQYGFDLQALYLRLDPAETPARAVEVATRVRIVVLAADRQTAIDFEVVPDGLAAPRPTPRPGARARSVRPGARDRSSPSRRSASRPG